MSLFSTEDDDESTQDEEQYCLKQSWPARPFAPFWLHSLTATRRALVVRQPTMFRNNVQNIAYTNIANVKTIGYWLPICKVEVNSLNGDIHVVVNKMPRRKAEHFAEVVMARVDFVGRASSNIAIHHPSLHKQQSNKQPEVQPLEKTEQFTDENDMEDQRDFKQERMRHTRLQNKGKRQ